MKLSPLLLESLCFSIDITNKSDDADKVNNAEYIFRAMGEHCNETEKKEIIRLLKLNLPPITSLRALSVMMGLNPGFLRSIIIEPTKYYRVFEIPKGKTTRQIEAPRIALKIIQKWLSVHFECKWSPQVHEAVHGFIKKRSHLTAASQHLGAEWVISLDIENFFPSTSEKIIRKSLKDLGYKTKKSLDILQALCCYKGRLSQGAPTSPILSNISLDRIDKKISKFSKKSKITYTRYADDLVFSGKGEIQREIIDEIKSIFAKTDWKISEDKISVAQSPKRLKVHGLLVHGEKIRLTKGYRNKIRAYKHLKENGKIRDEDRYKILGHINYAGQVENFEN